ncbi:hypothetical protein D3C84_859030 [compost metagenome]
MINCPVRSFTLACYFFLFGIYFICRTFRFFNHLVVFAIQSLLFCIFFREFLKIRINIFCDGLIYLGQQALEVIVAIERNDHAAEGYTSAPASDNEYLPSKILFDDQRGG